MCLIRFIHMYWASFSLWPKHQQGPPWCLGLGFCFSVVRNSFWSPGHTQGHGTGKTKSRFTSQPPFCHSCQLSLTNLSVFAPVSVTNHSEFSLKSSNPLNILLLRLQRSPLLPTVHDIFLWLSGTNLWGKTPEANAIPSLLSIVFQSLHKWLTSQLPLSSRKSTGRFHTERAF